MSKVIQCRATDTIALNSVKGRDGAIKTLIAAFAGESFVAEKEGGELRIFLLTDEPIGQVAVQNFNAKDMATPSSSFAKQGLDATRDRARQSEGISEINKRNAEFWKRPR